MANHLGVRTCTWLLSASFVGALLGAPKPRPSVAVPPPTEPAATQPTSRPSWPPMPAEQLLSAYQIELGNRFRADQFPTYRKAHELIERYFETGRTAERAAIAKQIEATEIDPVVVGRLCRIRTYWPALDPAGIYYVNEKVGIFATRYFFGLPKQYDRTKAWPLVIKLPTAGAFLTTPPPTAQQVTEIYSKWIHEEQALHPDTIVLMPLLNLDELWGPSYGGTAAVMQPLQHVTGRANVDPSRVYMVGEGMSAHATWNLALHYPTYFSAFNSMAGGASQPFQRIRVINLKNVLPIAWHDVDDKVVPVGTAQGIVKALRIQKINVDYEETKGLGHTPTAEMVERMYQKMRARTRELYPASVSLQSNRPDTAFNRCDWVQVYQTADPGEEHKASFGWGSGVMRYNDNAHKVEASIANNRINVNATNVDSMRIYLNDQLVDLTKPVTIMVNGRAKFEGLVKPNIDELLKDQGFLGRGWRYYTAVVDIDVVPRAAPQTRPVTTRSVSPKP